MKDPTVDRITKSGDIELSNIMTLAPKGQVNKKQIFYDSIAR